MIVLPSPRPIGAPLVPPSALLTNLAAYFKLEEASGTRVDATGNGYDLAPTNAPGNASGQIGNAVSLVAASGQYLSATIGTGVHTKLSVSAWSNRSNAGTDIIVWGWTGVPNHRLEYLAYTDGNFYGACESGSASYITAASGLTGWHHIVLVYDGTQGVANNRLKMYRDGALVAVSVSGTLPATFDMSGGAFYIGYDPTAGYLTNGRTDEVAVYLDRALSAADALQLYNCGVGGISYPFSGQP